MKAIVIDASVAIKWFVPEVHSEVAIRLLDRDAEFLVPDLIFAEIGNILWKKCRLKQLTLNNANAILHDFKRLPFNISSMESLLDGAWKIATKYQCTLYDSLYLALAQIKKCSLATADRALYNMLQATPLCHSLLWVEDISEASYENALEVEEKFVVHEEKASWNAIMHDDEKNS